VAVEVTCLLKEQGHVVNHLFPCSAWPVHVSGRSGNVWGIALRVPSSDSACVLLWCLTPAFRRSPVGGTTTACSTGGYLRLWAVSAF
jgi:hypothetical protein